MPDTPQQAAATRRRWLSVGEVVGVLALLISAASLWDSHRQHAEERAAAAQARPVAVAPLVLKGSVTNEGETLTLAANHDRIIQTQTVTFPTALAVDAQDSVGNPRIEATWFSSGLRSALPGKRVRGRLPVLIATRYLDDGTPGDDLALYEIGHGWRSRLIGPDMPVLEGITLVARGNPARPADMKARLDARWAALHPG